MVEGILWVFDLFFLRNFFGRNSNVGSRMLYFTLPETNIVPKMMVSNRNLLFRGVIFRCHVSFREGTLYISW